MKGTVKDKLLLSWLRDCFLGSQPLSPGSRWAFAWEYVSA